VEIYVPSLAPQRVWQTVGTMSNVDVPMTRSGTPLEELDDASLVHLVEARDERAIEELVRRYDEPLYSFAYRFVGSETFAQDVVQEVFLTLWRDAARYDPARGEVSSWLLTMTRYKAIDLVRRETGPRRRTVEADLSLEPSNVDVYEEAWLSERRDRVRAALQELTESQREAVTMAFYGGLTYPEVAAALSIPLGTAKTRIRDGLIRLRRALGDSLNENLAQTEPSGGRR
jgi:RNA polymerase sigma-70 factor (ECF subfamily)